ncbi:hypothetical protein Tco_1459041 [Tanacetum coccineum]
MRQPHHRRNGITSSLDTAYNQSDNEDYTLRFSVTSLASKRGGPPEDSPQSMYSIPRLMRGAHLFDVPAHHHRSPLCALPPRIPLLRHHASSEEPMLVASGMGGLHSYTWHTRAEPEDNRGSRSHVSLRADVVLLKRRVCPIINAHARRLLGAYDLRVATPRAVVHGADKTSGDARSWYMISEDAKSRLWFDKGKWTVLENKDVHPWGFGI